MPLAVAARERDADANGVIFGYRFTPDAAGEPIDTAAALAWLARPATDGSFVWLHLNLARSGCVSWMQTHLDLPDEFYETLGEGVESSRLEPQSQALLAVINDVTFSLDLSPADVATLWSYTDRRLIVTAHAKPLRLIDRLHATVGREEPFRSALELLVYLLREQADVLIRVVRRTGMEVDRVEDDYLETRESRRRVELGAMRRVLVRLQRLLAPETGSMFRLLNRPPAWLRERDLQDLRESAEEFSLVLGDLGGLVERIKLLQEEMAAQVNESSSRTLFTLTLVTVLALPINIVAGIFGMNVGGIPLADSPHGFWVMVLLVATFTVLAGYIAFRRQRQQRNS